MLRIVSSKTVGQVVLSTYADEIGRQTTTEREGSAQPAATPARAPVLSARTFITAALLALSYYGGVRVGFALSSVHAPISLLWPTNAILLSALLLSPRRTWPLLIAAAFPAHLLAEVSVDVPVAMVLCWFVSNVCEALIGAFAIWHFLGRAPRFTLFREFLVFLIWGAFLGPFLSSFLDAAFVAMVGWRYVDYWSIWSSRFFSNVLAALTIVPLVVTCAEAGLKSLRRVTLREVIEATALFAGLAVTCHVLFYEEREAVQSITLLYLPLPFLIWAAMRLGVTGVSVCIAIVASFAISGVLGGRGPFDAGDAHANAMAVQVFLIIAAASLLFQSVSLAELRHARLVAVRQGERLQLALSGARMGTWDWVVGSDRIAWTTAVDESLHADKPRVRSSVDWVLASIHPEDRAHVSEVVTRALQGCDHFDVEFRWLNEEGTRWVHAKGKLDSRDNVQRILGIHMDITERKAQDLQMQTQRDQLAHLSRVALVGELSGALAHELNQPLTAIMTNAQAASRELIGDKPDLVEVKDILIDIIADDKRAGDVIRRLRALFLGGALDMSAIDVNECVRDVLALEHSDFLARMVTADIRLARDLPPIRADRVQLQQVILNLIVNACDAMRENPPARRRLNIATYRTNDGYIGIDVSDRGAGILDLQKIFEPFYTTKDHGLGLGLTICQSIIKTHQGRLWATNNAKRGATMHVTLPVADLNS